MLLGGCLDVNESYVEKTLEDSSSDGEINQTELNRLYAKTDAGSRYRFKCRVTEIYLTRREILPTYLPKEFYFPEASYADLRSLRDGTY